MTFNIPNVKPSQLNWSKLYEPSFLRRRGTDADAGGGMVRELMKSIDK